MNRKLLGLVCTIAISTLICSPVLAAPNGAFAQHYDAAQDYLTQGQYSSAIV